MSLTIAETVVSCLESFESFASVSVAKSEGESDSRKPEWRIGHELSRFKVWSGNIGAHQRGKSSLDYRLRDATHLSTQVKALLQDLKDALENALSISNGTKSPWDQELSSNKSDDGSISGPDDDDIGFATEMDQISVDITEVINCLMKLSVSIRNPAPHDRFRGSIMTDTSFYEPTDIAHVQAKYGQADPGLITLLGKANTRRRQYFKYRESHHQKLSRGLDIDFDASKTTSERQSTVASSIPYRLKESPLSLDNAVDADELSDSGFTQTSYASSANISDRPRFPALPSEAANGPFQCPFCFGMISVTTSYAWRKHIFADLRPYICVPMDCPIAGTEFGRRYQWMQHMLQNHWREWHCVFCVHQPFTSTSKLRNHLQSLHAEAVLKEGIETAIHISEHSSSFDAETKCPLCDYSLASVKIYRHHMGRHLEDIALFVLPHIPGEEGVSDDEDSSRSSSELDSDYADIYNEEKKKVEYTSANEEIPDQIDSTAGQWHVQPGSPDHEELMAKVTEDNERLETLKTTMKRQMEPMSALLNSVMALRLSDPAYQADQDTGKIKRTEKHPATFQCTLCPKRFTRAYNLRSHLRTHTDERPFVCTVCGKAFARQHDRKRHEGLHAGEKKFVCKGDLKSGGRWGCGRRFARADALGRHLQSEAGRICIKPLLDEETVVVRPNDGLALPASLLDQYPALSQVNWKETDMGYISDDVSGRSSVDESDNLADDDTSDPHPPGMGYTSDYGR